MTDAALASSSLAIEIDELRVVRGGRAICDVSALTVAAGERLGIVGANGIGKTTLLRVLAGLEDKYNGAVSVAWEPFERVYVHQAPFLFRGSVIHNVAYGLRARGTNKADARDAALRWLYRLGVAELADRNVRGLSGGERRRVAIARACVLRPKLLLLDEPFSDLDQSGIDRLQESIQELAESTVLIASPLPLDQTIVDRCVAI